MNERKKIELAGADRVKPLPGSFIDRKMRKNAEWLFSLNPDRIIASLREACGLDTKGCAPYEGWGGFWSHYLRSAGKLYETYHGIDEKIADGAKERALYMAHAMAECQEKTGETVPIGMLSPSEDRTLVDRTHFVRDSVYSHTHISSIFYGIHKEMVALILTYRVFGDERSLHCAERMGKRVYDVLRPFEQTEREKMTDSRRISDFFSEAGGIMDAFLMLFEDTQDPMWTETAAYFRRSWFDDMFLSDKECMGRNMEHANSEMPYVESLVDLYLDTGDESALETAKDYMKNSYLYHELPQGSVSGRSAYQDYQSELYNYPKRVWSHVMDTKKRKNIQSGESCCSHNLNRVCAKLLQVGADPFLADAWDRRYVNAVLAQQNPDTGMFIYNLNLKNHTYKMWGYPTKSFWCCYGTGAAVFSALTEGAFYEKADAVYTCLYMPCEYRHRSGLVITEKTDYPDSGHVEFEFHGEAELSFMLRLPGWLRRDAKITLPDGETVTAEGRQCFYEIRRQFRDGDRITLELPFDRNTVQMPDREEYVSVYYGPNLEVLCATGDSLFTGSASELAAALEPTGVPCEFAANFSGEHCGGAGTHIVKPLRKIRDEIYCGYFRVTKPAQCHVTDRILIGEMSDCEAHGLHGKGIDRQVKNEHALIGTTLTFFSEAGEIYFGMHSDPEREMLLRLYLDGSAQTYIHQFSGHIVNPLFDLQILDDGEWKTFSTKSMEGDFEGEIYYENFVIPEKWTHGKDQLSFRILARNFHEIPGVVEWIADRIELYYTEDTAQEASYRGDRKYVANAQGLI